ncbi:MAG: FtsX-like permease family protein, partial [Bacteroidota bacterium]
SYDQFHKRKDNIYTVPLTWHFGTTTLPTARATSNIGPILKENFSEVKEFLRFAHPGQLVVKTPLLTSTESNIFFADSTFFNFFDFELIEGSTRYGLMEPNSIILTEKLASKYFGHDWRSTSLLGKSIEINNIAYEVSGLIELPPSNSHIQFEGLASFSTLPESKGDGNFDNSSYMTYVYLEENANLPLLKQKINEHFKEQFNGGTSITLDLTSLTDIYLKSRLTTGIGPISDIQYVYIFSIIGIVIILIACINYMNLATARSVERAKEIGVRKVMGAYRKQLTAQFLSESFFITFIAIIFGLGSLFILLPFFNELTGKSFNLGSVLSVDLFVLTSILWINVALLAGAYPALMLSGFKISNVLKGSFKNSGGGSLLRRVLVILQFSISSILIISTIVVYEQLHFIQVKNLGFDQEQIMSISIDDNAKKQLDFIKQEFNSYNGVVSSAATFQLPDRIHFETALADKEGEENRHLMRATPGDVDYLKTFSLSLIMGRDFNDLASKEEYQFIVNEQVLKFFGWSDEEAVGKRLKIWGSEWGTVTGVVKDFHFASLHETIKPLVIFYQPEKYFLHHNLTLKLEADNITETISRIENKWKALFPETPFTYSFLDDQFDQLYAKEQKLSQMFTVFAVIAILIGALGLFGLASYTAFQRSKEIGVRKVLGASVASITLMLSKNFTKQVVVSLVLSLPVAYFLMDTWLESFAYRIQVGWTILLFSALLVLLVTWLTVAYKSVTAALTNPVDTLRNE